jgi:hypothetical protein
MRQNKYKVEEILDFLEHVLILKVQDLRNIDILSADITYLQIRGVYSVHVSSYAALG